MRTSKTAVQHPTRPDPACRTLKVACNAEQNGELVPVRFKLGKEMVEIDDVRDRWLSHDHRYFKVGTASGNIYILRHGVEHDVWELVFYKARGAPPNL